MNKQFYHIKRVIINQYRFIQPNRKAMSGASIYGISGLALLLNQEGTDDE